MVPTRPKKFCLISLRKPSPGTANWFFCTLWIRRNQWLHSTSPAHPLSLSALQALWNALSPKKQLRNLTSQPRRNFLPKKGWQWIMWCSPVPRRDYVKYAQENECTLIAIATHGHGGFRRFALGSTADYVVHHSAIPVLNRPQIIILSLQLHPRKLYNK